MLRIYSLVSTGLIIMIISTGCNPDVIYEKNHSLSGTWERSEKPEFNVEITDTLTPVNFLLNIRHNTSYPYSNLFLFINTFYPNGMDTRDTVEILLARPDGEWLGSGLGKLKSSRIMLKQGVVFTMTGTYTFQFEQAMRVKELQGMEDFGITIEKMQEN